MPKFGLGETGTYLLFQWDALGTHLEHCRTNLKTNCVTNAIRPSANGKKNWQFIGHLGADLRMAVLYSIVRSCIRHG